MSFSAETNKAALPRGKPRIAYADSHQRWRSSRTRPMIMANLVSCEDADCGVGTFHHAWDFFLELSYERQSGGDDPSITRLPPRQGGVIRLFLGRRKQ
jgi:hypothetical protein